MRKINKKEILEKNKKGVSEFKAFISKGNIIDMAIGVIIGAAFGKIVTSLVNDILMPIIGVIIGGIDFTGLVITFKDAKIYYGNFIQNIIDFLIVAFCIFIFTKALSKLNRKEKKKEEIKEKEEILLLREIRDELKKKSGK